MNCHGGIDVTDDGRGELVLLAIDVRNTHTVVGLISGSGDHGKVVHQWRIRTETEVTSDELALTIDGLIGDDSERLTGAAGLSTVPSVLHEVREMLEQYWPSVPHVLIEPGFQVLISRQDVQTPVERDGDVRGPGIQEEPAENPDGADQTVNNDPGRLHDVVDAAVERGHQRHADRQPAHTAAGEKVFFEVLLSPREVDADEREHQQISEDDEGIERAEVRCKGGVHVFLRQ